jgi:hypothetical protein
MSGFTVNRVQVSDYCRVTGTERTEHDIIQLPIGMVADSDSIPHMVYKLTCSNCGRVQGYGVPGESV